MTTMSSTAMCNVSPEMVAGFCAKYAVAYDVYSALVARIKSKLGSEDIEYTPVAEDGYKNISADGSVDNLGTSFINMTYEQVSQMVIFVRSHSPLGARVRIPQVMSWFSETYKDKMSPCDSRLVKPDVILC